MLCCLGWGGNFVVSAWALSTTDLPPFMLASLRAAFVLLIMGVFLFRPIPQKFALLLCVSLAVGFLHLGFLYTGLQTAPASGSSVVAQMLIPMATLLSVIFLKERIGRVRAIAITTAFFGVCFMVYEPGAFQLDWGLFLVFLAYASLAVGSILMKLVGDIDWKVYVAWTAVVVFSGSVVTSFFTETGQVATIQTYWLQCLVAAIYAAICVSIFAHGQYFRLLQRYDVSVVVPLTLMMTVFATVLGITFLDEKLEMRYIIGAAIILPSVYIIARRQSTAKTAPEMMET